MSTFEAEFGQTADGHLAAKVGDAVYAMLPSRVGRFRISTTMSTRKPIAEVKENDLFGHMGMVDDEAGFQTYVAETAEHLSQKAALDRVDLDIPRKGVRTPWGKADHAVQYGAGIISYGTPGHGGFKVYKKQNDLIPAPYRNKDGWYEEDQEWAKVAAAFPLLFTTRELRQADRTLRNDYPDDYEAVNGVVLTEADSTKRAEEAFAKRHANDYVVISAVNSSAHPGMVDCHATIAGERSRYEGNREIKVENRRFLVPSAEYDKRSPFGFVIDLDRHEPFEKPQAAPTL